jgi:peroxiredoxin
MRKMIGSVLFLVLFAAVTTHAQDAQQLAVGNSLPKFVLPSPEKAAIKDYLGLSETTGTFTIDQIAADVVIIEIFSMYCPFCQLEAPKVNELDRLIRKDRDLAGSVKIIGIGVGNSPFEVDYFRKTYQIDFPLFPDEDFTIHKQSGEVRTPFFIGVKKNASAEPVIFLSHLGGFESAEKFLKQIKSGSGL